MAVKCIQGTGNPSLRHLQQGRGFMALVVAFGEMKKAVKNDGKQRLNFQYDPSDVLNFDDGCYDLRKNSNASQQTQSKDCPTTKNSRWVYVLWVNHIRIT
ncbi:hypothetical protein HHK36_005098 [Tetracentron sinense]|uniref:Uncharacterized protein n=1 Tax=Tetracentron sinense TaxID=13715 RepID=A0A834ZTJ1_TETSI|nr:hypothetical protein HHK36_005098 [Tetracentron sinense]